MGHQYQAQVMGQTFDLSAATPTEAIEETLEQDWEYHRGVDIDDIDGELEVSVLHNGTRIAYAYFDESGGAYAVDCDQQGD